MKRKTVLKKIVANITMGNDSEFRAPLLLSTSRRADAYGIGVGTVSPLFTDVVQCLGTPLLEIKKSGCVAEWVQLQMLTTQQCSGVSLPRVLRSPEGRPATSRHSELPAGT